MSAKFMRFLAMIIATICVMFAAATVGPLSSIPGTVLVNDAYLSVVREHELMLGACGFASALLFGILAKLAVWVRVVSAILAGTLYYVLAQGGDPDFWSYAVGGLMWFHFHFLASGALVFLLYTGAAVWWRS